MTGSSIPSRNWDVFYFRHRVQTGSGPTQSSVKWVPGVKRPRRETDHSSPSGTEVKNESSWRDAELSIVTNLSLPLLSAVV
jgi:hypothetical protein